MAVAAYAKAIFGALVLEGLRAGVWTGVNRGADSWAPAERPSPALEDTSSPAQFSECPARSIAWQCPPCPECPACPDAQYVVSPSHSQWSTALASLSQLTLGFLAATCQYGCGRWGLARRARQAGPDTPGTVPGIPGLPPAPRPGQLGILE